MTSNEIKGVKINDITFEEGEYNEIAKINIYEADGNLKRIVTIENLEIVNDIKLTMKEDRYINFLNGSKRFYKFKDTTIEYIDGKKTTLKNEYLIKPLDVGVNANNDEGCVCNPSIVLKGVFNNIEVAPKCDGIDIPSISIEDIARSKILYMMSEGYEVKELVSKYSCKADGTLYGWRTLVGLKYGNTVTINKAQ
jgi:hypothetical protein